MSLYHGSIIAVPEDGPRLTGMGITLGPWQNGAFEECSLHSSVLAELYPFWGYFHWDLKEVKNNPLCSEGEVNNKVEQPRPQHVKEVKKPMARRMTRANPLAGGEAPPAGNTTPEVDPFAAVSGEEADPFADFAAAPAVVEQGGLDALQGELAAGSSAVSPSASAELLAHINHLVLAQQNHASAAEVKTLADYVTSRFQAMEAANQQLSKQLENTYKLLGSLPATISEAMRKWFDESLAQFTAASGTVTATAGKPPASTAAASSASNTAAAAKPAENPLHKSILDATLPEVRKRKAANPKFALRYESTGPAVWGAMAAFSKTAGVECAPADAEAAYKAAGRLKGGDDIDLS